MPRILCFGDTHFCIKNIEMTRALHEKLMQLIPSLSIDFIVILGDFFDNKKITETYAMIEAKKFIYDLSVVLNKKVFMLVGNHDIINETEPPKEDCHTLVLFKGWLNVTVVDKVIKYEDFIFSPFVPPKYGLFRYLDESEYKDVWRNLNCVFSHSEINGALYGNIVTENSCSWTSELPMYISGHIHNRQQILNNAFYIGSAYQVEIGRDKSDKTGYIAIYDSDVKSVEFIDIKMPIREAKRFSSLQEFNSFIDEKGNENELERYFKIYIDGLTKEEYLLFNKTIKPHISESIRGKVIANVKVEKLETPSAVEKSKNLDDILNEQLSANALELYNKLIIRKCTSEQLLNEIIEKSKFEVSKLESEKKEERN